MVSANIYYLCYYLIFIVIWQGTDKIKRDILCQDYRMGGLKMVHLENFALALKIRSLQKSITTQSKWHCLLKEMVKDLEVDALINLRYLERICGKIANPFWKEAIVAWMKILAIYIPINYQDALAYPLWNLPLTYSKNIEQALSWEAKGVKTVGDIIGVNGNFLRWPDIKTVYKLKGTWLDYYSLQQSISPVIIKLTKKANKPACIPMRSELVKYLILEKSFKDIYQNLNLSLIREYQFNRWQDLENGKPLDMQNIFLRTSKLTNQNNFSFSIQACPQNTTYQKLAEEGWFEARR